MTLLRGGKYMMNLKIARMKKKLKQAELAKLVGVSEVSIGKYEQGKGSPSTAVLIKLSKVLEVSTDYLLGLED
jgi:transcriptional regulator with XRE-family HTH domain